MGKWHVDLSALCTPVQTQGCCLAGLNMAVFLLIGKTSALTMNIAGVVKDWMLIGLSVLLYASPVTPLNLGGYFLAFLAGEFCSLRNLLICLVAAFKLTLLSISLLCPCSLLL